MTDLTRRDLARFGGAALVAAVAARSGLSVEEVAVRARSNGKGPRHVIWFATNGR